jgi:hypothetical protein
MRRIVSLILAVMGLAVAVVVAPGSIYSGSTSRPCDIYGSGGTPCVAAHSTTRALYAAYKGPLYQVRRSSDNTTRNIGLLSSAGYANAGAQDSFCSGTSCVITKLYDQSPQHNDRGIANNDNSALASALPITLAGHKSYGIRIDPGMGYDNRAATGTAIASQPDGAYMVTSALYTNNKCCFDYGNAERVQADHGAGTMSAAYFGKDCWSLVCQAAAHGYSPIWNKECISLMLA